MAIGIPTCAQFANLAYQDTLPNLVISGGLQFHRRVVFAPHGSGMFMQNARLTQVIVYESDFNDFVVAFKGTKKTNVNDLTSDIKLVVAAEPKVVGDIRSVCEKIRLYTTECQTVTLVGHSLGGYYAQAVASVSQPRLPFVTFASPGLGSSHEAQNYKGANFYINGDVATKVGTRIGRDHGIEDPTLSSMEDRHSMNKLEARLSQGMYAVGQVDKFF